MKYEALNRVRKAFIIFSVWTLLAFPYASHLYLYLTIRGFKTTWVFQLIEALAATYSWALLTPLLLKILNAYPVLSAKPQKLAIHLPAAFGISLLQVVLHTLADAFLVHLNEPLQLWDRFSTIFSRTYFFGLIIYALALCLYASFEFFKRKEIESARIRMEIAESELKLLKAQLQPHFLFNTMNTIVSMIYQDPDSAHLMISKLSQLLRMTLDYGTEHTIPLQQELELAKTYVEIEKIRFQNRLSVEYEIDPELPNVNLPCMILQPLVENSIRHGLEQSNGRASITIAATVFDNNVLLSVRDNGSLSVHPNSALSNGTGLSNVKLRLEKLYGNKAELKIGSMPSNGVEVKILLPLI